MNRGTYKEVSGGGDHLDYGNFNILYCTGVTNAAKPKQPPTTSCCKLDSCSRLLSFDSRQQDDDAEQGSKHPVFGTFQMLNQFPNCQNL